MKALIALLAATLLLGASSEEITRISETYGHEIGSHLETPLIKLDVDAVIAGVRKGANGEPSPMTPEEYDAAITKIQQEIHMSLADENLKQAQDFLATNKTKKGIVELVPDRLQYTIQKAGQGEAVKEDSTAMVLYSGRYIDGTEFSASDKEPIAFHLPDLIEGFRKGVLGMQIGEKRTLYIHPELGYGDGQGPLPPNSLLIFDVEVVSLDGDSSS